MHQKSCQWHAHDATICLCSRRTVSLFLSLLYLVRCARGGCLFLIVSRALCVPRVTVTCIIARVIMSSSSPNYSSLCSRWKLLGAAAFKQIFLSLAATKPWEQWGREGVECNNCFLQRVGLKLSPLTNHFTSQAAAFQSAPAALCNHVSLLSSQPVANNARPTMRARRGGDSRAQCQLDLRQSPSRRMC